MTFHPPDQPVPTGLRTAGAVLRPLTTAYAEIDHAALMSSRERLRRWSGTDWPSDEFTVEENREDLARHEREHGAGVAFTFTVLSPDERECVGCVYVTPLADLADANPELGEVAPHDAVIGFWVVEHRADVEGDLLEDLDRWLTGAWAFRSVRFSTNTADLRQMDLMESHGFRRVGRVRVPGRRGPSVLWGR